MKIHKHPFFLSPNSSPPTPSPACSSSSPFTLCALTSLTMRVIGISKCWRGQKGTQHHPENLIGECLEAQHSKGESLLNYIYIYISLYAYLHITSFILALLAFFFFIPKAAHHHLRKQHKHLSLTHHHFFDLLPITISKTSIFLLLSSFQSPYFQPHVLFFLPFHWPLYEVHIRFDFL